MPVYISLVNFTTEGVKTIKDSPNRAARYQEIAKACGGKPIAAYATFGAYDLVAINEYPDNASAMKAALQINAIGAVTTQTLVGIPIEEFMHITQSV
ncbi:MAG: GYD domain-containing protein [Candidatus Latescibacteria bacterium]|nr:GYD domain-containing protein [Candidatus Latescibacterota bacterium]